MQLSGKRAPARGHSLLLDKLESGVVALETEQGPVYVQPSGWQRLYLVWTFRHFKSLPLKSLNSRQQKLVGSLPRCSYTGFSGRLDRARIIGRVEGLVHLSSDGGRKPLRDIRAVELPSANERQDTGRAPSPLARAWTRKAIVTVAALGVMALLPWHRILSTHHSRDASTATLDQVSPPAPVMPRDTLVNASLHFNSLFDVPTSSDAQVEGARKGTSKATTPALDRPLETTVSASGTTAGVVKNAARVSSLMRGDVEPPRKLFSERVVPDDVSRRIQYAGPPSHMVYPECSARVRGKVDLKAIIGSDGRVRDVTVVSGNKQLSRAAASAIRLWRYEPHFVHGLPTETEANVRVSFIAADAVSISFPVPEPRQR